MLITSILFALSATAFGTVGSNAVSQQILAELPPERLKPKKFPVLAIHRMGYKTADLVDSGVTLCGAVETNRYGTLYVTQDSVVDRAFFEVTDKARRIDLGDGQACFEGYVRRKDGRSQVGEFAPSAPPPPLATDGMPYEYWLTN